MYMVEMSINLHRPCVQAYGSHCTARRMAGPSRRARLQATFRCSAVFLALFMLCIPSSAARKLLQASADGLDTVESYTCIGSGVMQHPCIVNPAYTFAVGFRLNSSHLPDRLYQSITSQHVVCSQLKTQAACQSTPSSAPVYCSWDAMNSVCMADPYASLVLPLSCGASKARSFIQCGRKGMINTCRTDTECVLGKQARCFPAWLVSEARAKNTTEQEIAEATALAILKGEEAVIGSCPESKLLQRVLQSCPYTAGWDTCDTSLCEFSTPTFIPSRVQALGLGNTTATVPTIYEAAMQPNSTSELPFYDTYPGPICFPDVGRTPMVLHSLLGVSEGVAQQLDMLQAKCSEAEDVVYDAALGVAGCGWEMFSYESESVYSTAKMQKPVLPAAGSAAETVQLPSNTSQTVQPSTTAGGTSQPAAAAANVSSSSSSSSPAPSKQQKVATEIGSRG